jgi:hypothetical protein
MFAVLRDLKADESLTLLNLALVGSAIVMAAIAAAGGLP